MDCGANVEVVYPNTIRRSSRSTIDDDLGRSEPVRPGGVFRIKENTSTIGQRYERRNRSPVIIEWTDGT